MQQYLGIDVGGTNIKYALVDENANVLEKNKTVTPDNKEDFLKVLKGIIKEYVGREDTDILGTGISFPGFIDSSIGYLRTAGALFYLEQTPLKEILEKEISIPIHIENDAKCVAISEIWNGKAKNSKNFICLTVGTGVGGAIVIDGKLYKGVDFVAGEFGFMITDINTLETLSTNGGIMPQRKTYAEQNNLNMKDVTGEMALSDSEIANKFYNHLGASIYNLIYILNPEKILIGGAISQDSNFIKRLNDEVERIGIDKNVNYKVESCHNLNDAGILGAVYELKTKYKI